MPAISQAGAGSAACPAGRVLPSFIQYLDAIQTLEQQGVQVKVSDLSDALSLPRPGVTRTVKDMEARGLLTKHTSPEDGRVTYLTITEPGGRFPANTMRNISALLFRRWRSSRKRMRRP